MIDDSARPDEVVTVRGYSGRAIARVGFQVQLYLLHGDDPAVRHRVVDLISGFADASPEIVKFQRHVANRLSPIAGKNLAELFHAEVERIDATIDAHGPHVTDSHEPPRWQGAALMHEAKSRGTAISYVHLSMPAELPALDPDEMVDRVLGWCRHAQPLHGSAGYALVSEIGMLPHYGAHTWPQLRRFSGLGHMGQYITAARRAERIQIQGVNWLTVLGAPMLDEIGGVERLTGLVEGAAKELGATAGEAVSLHEYDGGVVIRAGRVPQMGDRTTDGVPLAYQVVYRALRPWVFLDYLNKSAHLLKVPDGVDALDATRSWATRFDV